MKKKIDKDIITHGSYSPGQVLGNFNIVQIQKAIFTSEPFILKDQPALFQERTDLSHEGEVKHDISNLGPMAEIYRLCHDSSYQEKFFNEWSKVTNFNTPTPFETAILGRKMLLDTIDLNYWPLRRTLAHIVGNAYNQLLTDRNLAKELGKVSEIAADSIEGQIFLSSTLSRLNVLTDENIEIINTLFKKQHPQVTW